MLLNNHELFTIVDLLPAGGDASASGYSSVPHSLGNLSIAYIDTVCPRSSDPFYIVTYYINWVPTSWIYSILYYCMSQKSSPFLYSKYTMKNGLF